MCVELLKIELASNEEYHRSHGIEIGVAVGFPFGCLEQSIERFDEAIGLSGLSPSHDAVEVVADHFGDLFHGFDFGTHDIGTPLLQHGRNDIDLFAFENVPQLLFIKPRTGGALGCYLGDQHVQVSALCGGQFFSAFEQWPAQPFNSRVGLLFGSAHLFDGGRGMCDDMEFVERNAGVGQVVADTFDKGWRHVDAGRSDVVHIAAMGGQVFGKRFDSLGVFPVSDEDDLALVGVGDQGQILLPALFGGLVDGDGADPGQVHGIHGQINVLGTYGVHAMPGFARYPRYGRERHLLGQHENKRLEQQGEAGQFADPIRLDQGDLAIRQFDSRNTDFEIAFVLEEVQMPVTLGLGIVGRMDTIGTGVSKPTASNKIDLDSQTLSFGIEVNTLNVPRIHNAQSSFKDLVRHGISH